MPTETAAYYKGHTADLLAAEGFNMDPTLAKMRMEGKVDIPEGANPSEWLTSNKWTANGIVAQDNRTVFAHAPLHRSGWQRRRHLSQNHLRRDYQQHHRP